MTKSHVGPGSDPATEQGHGQENQADEIQTKCGVQSIATCPCDKCTWECEVLILGGSKTG